MIYFLYVAILALTKDLNPGPFVMNFIVYLEVFVDTISMHLFENPCSDYVSY